MDNPPAATAALFELLEAGASVNLDDAEKRLQRLSAAASGPKHCSSKQFKSIVQARRACDFASLGTEQIAAWKKSDTSAAIRPEAYINV